MPIPFQCDCGKKMTAKEEFAGRRLRCPDCQRVVTIPKPVQAAGSPPMFPAGQPAKTLTRSEVVAMTQQARETPAPTNTTAEPDFGQLFGTSPAAQAAPVARRAAPAAAPVAGPVASTPADGPPQFAVHPWVDTSFEQVSTPWGPGDYERFQHGIRGAREWEFPLGWIAAIAVVVAVALVA